MLVGFRFLHVIKTKLRPEGQEPYNLPFAVVLACSDDGDRLFYSGP